MTVQIEIDKKVLAEFDEAIKVLRENREDVFRETFRELTKKKKREAEVARHYAEAYRKNPVQSDEFEIEDEQMEKFWEQTGSF